MTVVPDTRVEASKKPRTAVFLGLSPLFEAVFSYHESGFLTMKPVQSLHRRIILFGAGYPLGPSGFPSTSSIRHGLATTGGNLLEELQHHSSI